MVTLKVTVEDEQADALKKLLGEVTFVKSIEEEHLTNNDIKEPETPYQRLKRIQLEIGNKELFKDIKDPSEWQREIRREWDRDF
jgi:ABC-type phosphate transport system auxiliary subunit